MPHATVSQDAEDERIIAQALDLENPFDSPFNVNRELDTGEKADDAVDFGDLGDDDLADEEDEEDNGSVPAEVVSGSGGINGSLDDLDYASGEGLIFDQGAGNGTHGEGDDDLFGERSSSPLEDGILVEDSGRLRTAAITSVGPSKVSVTQTDLSTRSLPDGAKVLEGYDKAYQTLLPVATVGARDGLLSKEQQLQQDLFAMSGAVFGKLDSVPVIETQDDLLAALWPRFERDTVPRFMDLLPPKKARYTGKTPLRRPKPVQPTKLNLEIAGDQEKAFRFFSSNRKPQEHLGQNGIITILDTRSENEQDENSEDMNSDFEEEPVGGVLWQDLQLICGDWDAQISTDMSSPDPSELELKDKDDIFVDLVGNLEDQSELPSAKRRKLGSTPSEVLRTSQLSFPPLHNPEHTTAKIAKAVTLDLNDAHILVNLDQPIKGPKNVNLNTLKGDTRRAFLKGLNRRYNISNDEAYDLLKENHQSKVRSTLGSMAIDHSLPAIKLQWPFYSTRMHKQQARSFHRPQIQFARNESVNFNKPKIIKKKHLRGRDIHSIFSSAKDLSLGDNSSVLLLEYSEEYPIVLSNFGMGNRLINYYRRRNMDDVSRPKLDIGETSILLPQDKSPFSIFGHIDPGERTSALHNAMYRAPVFKHEPRSTDFLVVRNRSGEVGHTYCMRNIENLHVVGQEFPSVDVPGPHSRKVTTASKNRLKMVSFRLLRQSDNGQIPVGDVTKHFGDSTDMQVRQKMKEFLQFSKESKNWTMRPGEAIPDEDFIRAMVKPEDVCLLESMEVGQQHLQDAGFSKGDEQSEDEEGKEGQSIEQQLAPWYTSRNFLNATQGKAMLQLHGEGDPSGRGEAFSFIKTSMKGGFKAVGESVEDKIDAKKLKELGGHSYNVARQQKSYEESIRRIWEAQKQSLASTMEQSDTEFDDEQSETAEESVTDTRTPRSELETPSIARRRDDETTSQFSKMSTNSQAGKILKITRKVRNKYGEVKQEEDIIRDPHVIHHYVKIRQAKDIDSTRVEECNPTGDADTDQRRRQKLEKELSRLQRNKERRLARDKQKGVYTDGAAESPASPGDSRAAIPAVKPAGTQRKCANCGQVGHIKTNKKCFLPSP
ncbi:MAG: hypothetical protein Q9191_004598 [Dirinaria sp. TL-2023a]